jgi:hypothetical protein
MERNDDGSDVVSLKPHNQGNRCTAGELRYGRDAQRVE